MNKTLLEKVRYILSNAGLSKCFWDKAVSTSYYLVNLSPYAPINFKTPKEVRYGTPANYFHLRAFGCPAYFYVNDGKLEPKAKTAIFLGYATG